MYSDEELDLAVAAGALTAEAAQSLRTFAAARRTTPAADEEHFRLITGFNDIFVVVAAALMLIAVAWLGGAFANWLGAALVAALAWLLAEFFVRKRRMALPAIVLLLAFVGGCFVAVMRAVGTEPASLVVAAAAAALAAWFHWRRFRVPITVAAGVGVISLGLVVSLLTLGSGLQWAALPLTFGCGLMAFALALIWDSSDLNRETRRSDVAFWLHLLAAQLLVQPMFAWFGILEGQIDVGRVLGVLLIYALIALLSLWMDRRALMVSALGYVVYALAKLLDRFGTETGFAFAVTALVIGAALLFLSAFWRPSRTFTLRSIPQRLRRLVPPA